VRNFTSGLSGSRLWLDKEPTIGEIWSRFQTEVKKSDKKVVWCGFREPTMRIDTLIDLTRKIKAKYPYLMVRLDTDGLAQLRNKDMEVAKELKDAGIDKISISLNAENEYKYIQLCNPSMLGAYKAVIDFTKDCKKYFSKVRLTIVNVGDINISKCKRIADELGCDFKVR
jgi:TatD family-associated radical SAM protein